MKVIIAGSRSFNDYEKLCSTCNFLLSNTNDIEIVSGGARGADKLGEQYANSKSYPIKQFLANWELGKSAGYKRNIDMANYADALIAFWDGESRGTLSSINLAEKYKKSCLTIRF